MERSFFIILIVALIIALGHYNNLAEPEEMVRMPGSLYLMPLSELDKYHKP